MAIILESEKKNINWTAIAGIIAVFVAVFASTYYLFFAPTPFIETIVPAAINNKFQIADIKLDDISEIEKSAVVKSLRTRVPGLDKGDLGRPNPFLVF